MDTKKTFSIVIPVYGNEKNIPITVPYIMEHLSLFPDYNIELIMVCDGSPDNSYELMKEYQEKYPDIIKIACFTRNFGQGAAIHCGMEMASGDVIGVISCDLQDPFELFVEMLSFWKQGYKLVIASRSDRKDIGLSAVGSKIFQKIVHKFINSRYPSGGFDFYLMDKEVAQKFCQIDAPNGSVQMLFLWLGYEYKEITYVRQERSVGKSTWNLGRKIEAAIGLVTTYSTIAVRIFEVLGIILFFLSMIISCVSIVSAVILGLKTWCLLLIVIGISGIFTGLLLCSMGILGEYIWRTYDLTKDRPRYIIRDIRK